MHVALLAHEEAAVRQGDDGFEVGLAGNAGRHTASRPQRHQPRRRHGETVGGQGDRQPRHTRALAVVDGGDPLAASGIGHEAGESAEPEAAVEEGIGGSRGFGEMPDPAQQRRQPRNGLNRREDQRPRGRAAGEHTRHNAHHSKTRQALHS